MVGCFGGPVRHQVERLSTGWACESGAQGWVGLEKKFPGCPGEANIVHGEPRVHGLWLWFPKVSPQHLSQPPLGWEGTAPPPKRWPQETRHKPSCLPLQHQEQKSSARKFTQKDSFQPIRPVVRTIPDGPSPRSGHTLLFPREGSPEGCIQHPLWEADRGQAMGRAGE